MLIAYCIGVAVYISLGVIQVLGDTSPDRREFNAKEFAEWCVLAPVWPYVVLETLFFRFYSKL